MKSWLIIASFFIGIKIGQSQPIEKPQEIAVINDIPIIIKTENSVISYQGDFSCWIFPGKIKITLLPKAFSGEFDHLIHIAPSKLSDEIKFVKTTLAFNKKSTTSNQMHLQGDNHPLIDTSLVAGDSLRITIEVSPSTKSTYVLYAKELIPVVQGFRPIKFVDSSPDKMQPRQIMAGKNLKSEYQSIVQNSIVIPAGHIPELRLKAYPLLKDSLIEYRISDESISGTWKKADHMLSFSNLVHSQTYKIDLRYKGQNKVSTYLLYINPFWYQTKVIRIGSIIFSLFILLFLTRGYYRNRLKNLMAQRQRLEEQLRTIQSQLNPHFIFNALNSIEGLVSMGETELANQYLNTFSAIMRETLRNADKLMISLREEINLLEKYVKIEKLRFDFNYTLTISNELALDEIEVPPMLIQPLLENAIKHGMTSMNKRDQISFEITKNNNDLKCTITNPNFPISGNKTTAGGYGISFTKQRLNHFNKLHPENPIELQQFKTDQIFVSQLQFHNWFS
jgi:hypothetical protein